MTLPGTQVNLLASAIKSSPATDTSTGFMAGVTDFGITSAAVKVQSLDEFESNFGERISGYSSLYDAVEVFFTDGGSTLYVARVIGPDPVSATANMLDAAGSSVPGDVALTVTAKTPGDWGNSLNFEIIAGDAGGEFKIRISHDDDGVLETSPSLLDRAAAVTWSSDTSDYVDIALGASSEDPRVQGPTPFTLGDDDRANITDTEWGTALDLFLRSLGPGQVGCPGRTTKEGHAQIAAHCYDNNRVGIVVFPDSALASDIIADAVDSRDETDPDHLFLLGAFSPWIEGPGVSTGTTRTVDPTGMQMGMIARSDAAGNSTNQPVAGRNAISTFATGLSQAEFSDTDRESLNDNGVNVIREVQSTIRTYGNVTLVDPDSDNAWTSFSNSRFYMQIKNQAEVIAEDFVFSMLDGQGLKIAEFNGVLAGMLAGYYKDGALYGATASEAFLVDTGSAVNTEATKAAGQLKAKLHVRMSPSADMVIIDIVKVLTSDSI